MAPSRRTRILIVDDSAAMRSFLRSVIVSDPSLEIAGTAADGASALGLLDLSGPDLILLDVEMPVMNGLETLKQLQRRGRKVPVIMCSSLTRGGASVTIEALASGASDYVTKPAGHSCREQALTALAQDLLPKIHALTGTEEPRPATIASRGRDLASLPPQARTIGPTPAAVPAVVAIGVSTGGPAALDVLLPELPASFSLPVLIVQHMPEVFTGLFAQRLNQRCPLTVREACEGDQVRPGNIFIARGGWHMEVVAPSNPRVPATIHLNQDLPENHCRPAVDVLFRSVAKVYGADVLGVVLTGMGSDGLAGSRAICTQGGSILAQDKPTSTVWGMPGAVTEAGLARKTLPLAAIAPEIIRAASRTAATSEAPARAGMAV